MDNKSRFARRAALSVLTATVCAALPSAVSAQAVGAYLHQGVIGTPAPTAQGMIRPSRPVTSGAVQNQPISNQTAPLQPTRLYPRPTSPIRTDLQPAPIVQSYSHGPVVTIPDAASSEIRPGIRFRNRQPSYPTAQDPEYNPTRSIAPVGPANGFSVSPSDRRGQVIPIFVRITPILSATRFR